MNSLKKRLLFLLTFMPITCLFPVAWASWPLQSHCYSYEKPLEYWVNKYDTIIVGRALEVRSTGPGRNQNDGTCWVRFSISEWLKGAGPEEIWVLVAVNSHRAIDYSTLEYCEFENSHTYIVYGRHNREPLFPPQLIITASSKGSGSDTYCPPNTELHLGNQAEILYKVRQIIKREASKEKEGKE